MTGRAVALALGLSAGAMVLLGWFARATDTVQAGISPSAPALAARPVPMPSVVNRWLAPATEGQVLRSEAEIEQRLFTQGSLRGSQLDGDWGVDGRGQLQPSLGLRRRFDQLLSTLGEVHVDELGRLLRARATAELSGAAADAVMAVWQRYLALQRRSFQHGLDDSSAAAWEAALAERQIVRRELLGRAWADAFFGAEEQALRAHLSRVPGAGITDVDGAASPSSLPSLPRLAQAPAAGSDTQQLFAQRSQAFGPEAAERLRLEDELARHWDARMALARAELARLQQAPELSALQRDQAIGRWLEQQFTEAERLRARALLGH